MSVSDRLLAELVQPAPVFARLERDELDGESSVHGYILDFSDEWVLIQTVTDFRLDGYCIIRRDHVTEARSQAYERHYDNLLKLEGVQPKAGLEFSLDLASAETLFRSLQENDLWIIAEREVPEDDFFLIGPVVRAGERSMSIHHFDALGEWEATPTLMRYERVTKVVFGSDYLNVWRRHMPPMESQ